MPNVIMFSSLSGHVVRGDRCLKDYGFRLSQARVDSAEVRGLVQTIFGKISVIVTLGGGGC